MMLSLVPTAAVETEQVLSTAPGLTDWEFSLNTSYIKTAELAVAFSQGGPRILRSGETGAVWGWSRPHAALKPALHAHTPSVLKVEMEQNLLIYSWM